MRSKSKFVLDFIRKSIEGGRVCASNRYFESKQFDEILSFIIGDLNTYDEDNSTVIDKYLKNIAKKEKEGQTVFIGDESHLIKINIKRNGRVYQENRVIWILKKTLRMINKKDLLVLYDFDSQYPSAKADKDNEWPAIEQLIVSKNA